MKLSVIVPCFNAEDTIGTQLKALARQRWSEPWEVIVSDNGSSDNTLAVADRFKTEIANLRIVDSSDRRGVAHAYNVGAQVATGDALAFCDADDEVGTGWMEAMGAALMEYDLVASRFEFKKLNTSWVQHSQGGPQQHGLQRLWYPPYLPHAGSCGLGVKKSLHEAVGGFDECLKKLVDTDYIIRLELAGTKLHFVPNAIIHVRFRTTFNGLFNQSRNWAKANVLLYKKYRQGMRVKDPWKLYLRDCRHLMRRFPRALLHKTSRANWIWQLGRQFGRLQGIIKYHVPPV